MSLVTIIIPYKNNLKYLFFTLQSIFHQTHKNYKVLIIYDDENFSDLTLIRRYLSKEKKNKNRIKIIINKKNLGAGLSRNIGIKISKSKYIAFLDSDDTWHKDKLKLQLNFMKKQKVLISHTSYNIINQDGKKISHRQAKKKLYYENLLDSCDIGLSTVIVDSNFLKKNNFNFPKIKTKEDFVLWLNILKKIHHIKGLDLKLTNYRKRKNSLSSNLIVNIFNGYRVYKDYMAMGHLESFYRLIKLSINYIRKTHLIRN